MSAAFTAEFIEVSGRTGAPTKRMRRWVKRRGPSEIERAFYNELIERMYLRMEKP